MEIHPATSRCIQCPTEEACGDQGTEVVIDESMGKWIPFFENTPEGVPHLSKIIRKPQGIGVEYKNVADAQTGIMLFLEIQEGKEAMAGKRYCDR